MAENEKTGSKSDSIKPALPKNPKLPPPGPPNFLDRGL